MEKMGTIIDLAVPPVYSDMVRAKSATAFKTTRELCFSAAAMALTSAWISAHLAKMGLDMAMDWLKTAFYPWACAAAEYTANSVTTNAVLLSRAAFRSSSAVLSVALQLVRGLSGSVAVRATELATAAADNFWSSSAGRMVTAKVTPLLEEGATAVLDAAGALWACPAMEAVRETVVPLVEKGAATAAEAIFHLCTSAVVEGKRLVKSHLMRDKLVSTTDRFALSFNILYTTIDL